MPNLWRASVIEPYDTLRPLHEWCEYHANDRVDTAGNMIQLRIPIGTVASAQMPRILPREYCSPISAAAVARELFSKSDVFMFSPFLLLLEFVAVTLCNVILNSP